MRWEAQRVRPEAGPPEAGRSTGAPPPHAPGDGAPDGGGPGPRGDEQVLPGVLAGAVRTVTTPAFAGMVFHEVLAKSALNKVPAASNMPFRYTVNPYRGCSHACVYCFARKTHTYLDLDAGLDFDSQVVVKLNVAEVLRAELARPSWSHDHVALGTNTDPYQRAEGRYRLMPGIIAALADSGTPFSILTKGTLLGRDSALLAEAARGVPVGVGLSIAMVDDALSASLEPGTPSPTARLRLLERLASAGIDCGVMAMPILPWLTDSPAALDALFRRLAGAGATTVTAGPLHLRPGAREWFMQWLAREHPALVGRYRRLYRGGTHADPAYRAWLTGEVAAARRRHGLAAGGGGFRRAAAGTAGPRGRGPVADPSASGQPALF